MAERSSQKQGSGTAALFIPIILLFFLSGATSLVYQVVWVRQFTRLFGGTALAVSTVLAAFMSGLALGSYLWGRRTDRHRRPLVVYGMLEIGIGVCALAMPLALSLLDLVFSAVYRAGLTSHEGLSLVRALGSFLVLIVPTTLMGGTLPILGRAVVERLEALGTRLGILYGANTFGAVVGAFGGGFFLIRLFGLAHTVWMVAALNGVIGLTALFLARGRGAPVPAVGSETVSAERETEGGIDILVARAVIIAFAVSGAAALALEVVWTRYLSMVLGTTVYAFSGMLTVFLLGLAVGSAVMGRIADRVPRPLPLLGWTQISVGVASLGTLFLFGKFPELFVILFHRWGSSWWGVVEIQLALAFAALILPALLFGSVFPIVAKIYTRELSRVGRKIGTAYAANTIGAVIGSLVGGFVLLPGLGIRGTTIFCALACMSVGLALIVAVNRPASRRGRLISLGGVITGLILLLVYLPGWDPVLMTRGVYMYTERYKDPQTLHRSVRSTDLLFYEEDPDGTVSVESYQGILALRVNGKVDAGTGHDMLTQTLVGSLPLALHPRPERALLIGLGSGVTLGAMEGYPLRAIRCVEISPAVVRASRYFQAANNDALGDPRLHLVRADARNLLLLEPDRYDCIISQPSNPWISGMGDLFTREFFQLMRDRLAPGGIVGQWIQIYRLSPEHVQALLATFQEVFPHVLLWSGGEGNLLAIGAADEVPFSISSVRERLLQEGVWARLEGVGFQSPESVMSMFLLGEENLRRYTGSARRAVTDDNLMLEFSAAQDIYKDTVGMIVNELLPLLQCLSEVSADGSRLPPDVDKALTAACTSRRYFLLSVLTEKSGDLERTHILAKRAFDLNPGDPRVREAYGSVLGKIAGAGLRREGPSRRLMENLEVALAIGSAPTALEARKDLGLAYYQMGMLDSAEMVWSEVSELDPDDTTLQRFLAAAKMKLGRVDEASRIYENLLQVDPDHVEALRNLAYILSLRGRELPRALQLAERAVRLDRSGRSQLILAQVKQGGGDHAGAVKLLERLAASPGLEAEANLYLGESYAALGRTAEARVALERVLETDRQGDFGPRAQRALEALGRR